MSDLTQRISERLRSGASVVIVEEQDELLALAQAQAATKQPAFSPVTVLSAADPDILQKLEEHKKNKGTYIIADFFRLYHGNALMARVIRELAVPRVDQEKYGRLVLIESPGVEIPQVLQTDVEYVVPALPTAEELKVELENFLKDQTKAEIAAGDEAKYRVANAVAGLARHEAARLFARCYVENNKVLDPAWLLKEKATRIAERLGGALTFVDTSDVANIGGLELLKKWLSARKEAFGSEKARKYGLPEPKGILLVGCPGTGKTLTCKVMAREWGLPFLRLDAGKLFGSLVGQSESQTRMAIQAAEACAPCVLQIDEIEKGFAGNNGGGSGDSGTSQRVFGQLLTWLQEKKAPVFVMATANRVDALPPELLRKGRFDEIFFLDLPNVAEREDIASIHLAKRKRKLNTKMIAQATENFSGAEIEQAIIDGMFGAYADGERDVKLEDVLTAVQLTSPLAKTMSEDIQRIRNWALSGRARLATAPADVESITGARTKVIG